ncbi:MAG: PQQ-dependent sugar dehydrogenase [Saprospiraceae bacterium]|nr:PQQ-dependent sugar dehydrogenase [Saprospiraceae bacterium]
MKFKYFTLLLFLPFLLTGQDFQLIPVAQGFIRPVDISHAGDERLFITEKDGTIAILYENGTKSATPFLDIKNRVNALANERGLLGLAFHPDYKNNGYFYVHYTNNSGNSTISRFKVSENNTEMADPTSELILMVVNQPFNNHNAGDLNFGPDGYLYIGMGDGGSGGDPGNRSQNPKDRLGKILRIDVDSDVLPFGIPADNPFVNNADTLQEIWSLGWRNPWRFSFDRLTGDMWVGDVGQSKWEEVNMEKAGNGGQNYGWRCYEGMEVFNSAGCGPIGKYVFPVHVYPNRFDVGCSLTGGYVYRGTQNPTFYGKYIFTDFCTGIFWTLSNQNDGWVHEELADLDNQDYSSFGEDMHGELYVAGLASGRIFRISDGVCSGFMEREIMINVTQPTCPGECNASILIEGDTTGLLVNGQSSFVITGLCSGKYEVAFSDSNTCVRVLEVEVPETDTEIIQIQVDNDTLIAAGSILSSYIWFLNGQVAGVTSVPVFVPSSSGSYYTVGLSAAGCQVVSDTLDFILSKTNEIVFKNKLIILGNPVLEMKLKWQDAENLNNSYLILDINGTLIRRFGLEKNQDGIYEYPVEFLPTGAYILVGGSNVAKFIVGQP